MKEHSYELRKKASVVADYYKTAGDDYEVRCQARERKTTIFEIVVTVPSEEAAKRSAATGKTGVRRFMLRL